MTFDKILEDKRLWAVKYDGEDSNCFDIVHSYDIDPHSYDVDPLEEGRAFKEQSLFACKQAAA